ncbi:MAG TPA: sulfurtransferase TusA family protein [Anaerolineales bacterium]|nr:sulfurtransferase TusA family protein [Anaerolineales bacterium]
MGVRRTETSLIVWTGSSAQETPKAKKSEPATPVFDATKFYDAGDKGCAMGPMDEIAALMLTMQPGQTLEINATDPTVEVDIGAWCRMTGHQLIDKRDTHYLVQHK